MRYYSGFLLVLLFAFLMPIGAEAADTLAWGSMKQLTYAIPDGTLLAYHEELSDGGLVLSTGKTTNDPSSADLAMDSYGSMGAKAITPVAGEQLQDATDRGKLTYSTTSVRVEIGSVYVITLHDGTYAKVRVDALSGTKAVLSYVLETGTTNPVPAPGPVPPQPAPAPPPVPPQPSPLPTPNPAPGPQPAPAPQPTPAPGEPGLDPIQTTAPSAANTVSFTAEEGQVKLVQDTQPGDVTWELLRSDNGAKFASVSDFRLTQPAYEDKYAFAGHTYLYQWEIFDANGKNIAESGFIRIKVVPKTNVPSPAIPESTIVLQMNNPNAMVNGKQVPLQTAPTTIDGRAMVPLRFIADAIGAMTEWNDQEQRITLSLNGDTIELWVDQSKAEVNGRQTELDVPPKVVNNITLVPVRFVSESLKQQVDFDSQSMSATIHVRRNAAAGGQ